MRERLERRSFGGLIADCDRFLHSMLYCIRYMYNSHLCMLYFSNKQQAMIHAMYAKAMQTSDNHVSLQRSVLYCFLNANRMLSCTTLLRLLRLFPSPATCFWRFRSLPIFPLLHHAIKITLVIILAILGLHSRMCC